jgi:hypothetical protein
MHKPLLSIGAAIAFVARTREARRHPQDGPHLREGDRHQGLRHQPAPAAERAVSIEFTPRKPGQVRYACGMDMVTGVLVVQ